MFGMQIPGFMLKQMYRKGSLENLEAAFQFEVHNHLMPAMIVAVREVTVAGMTYELADVEFSDGANTRGAASVSEDSPVDFGKGTTIQVRVNGYRVNPGAHQPRLKVKTEEFGSIAIEVSDTLSA